MGSQCGAGSAAPVGKTVEGSDPVDRLAALGESRDDCPSRCSRSAFRLSKIVYVSTWPRAGRTDL
jgi:hypothetical protein